MRFTVQKFIYNIYKASFSPVPVQQIILYYLFRAQTTAVVWTPERSYKWPPPSLSLLCFLCGVSPCAILRTFSFSWLWMSSACLLHNFVMYSYTYGIWKATCLSRTDVHLGRLPMVRRTLFCRRCNFNRWVSAANSQAGSTKTNTT
jgi:hypothetical protein